MRMVHLPEVEPRPKRWWVAADLDAFVDSFTDTVRREVLHGALLVTPAPSPRHAVLVVRLASALSDYCERHRAGIVCAPGVVRWGDNQLEPDIAVFPPDTPTDIPWADFPRPLLVIEVQSPSTALFDRTVKRDAYRTLDIPEYWRVVPDESAVIVSTPNGMDTTVHDVVLWSPPGTDALPALRIPVSRL